MNERIKLLAREAGFYANPDVEKLEKFAELIVKECGVALYPMLYKTVSRGQAYDLIKQHFGKENNK